VKFRSIVAATACAGAGALVVLPFASGQSSAQDQLLFAAMNGKKEVDSQGNKNTGDKDGAGTFTALVEGKRLCFGITVRNLDGPVAAHIHSGGANKAGPVVIPLTQPSGGNPGASSGCVNITSAQSKALLKNPKGFYANVHTQPFPNGAVRGQLFARSG
jgi:hypothetical protein